MNAVAPITQFRQMVEARKGEIAARLPKHMTVERVMKVLMTAAVKTPKIMECTKESIFLSIYQGAELGLEPGSSLGEGYLVPYSNTCQFIPGYRGLIALARRSGEIVSIEAHTVHVKDEFVIEFGLNPRLVHRPAFLEPDRGDIVGFYAVARLKDGGIQYEFMSRGEVDAIRAKSKAGKFGPWVDHYPEMGKKTVIRRLAKMLPLSVEMAGALDLQAKAEAGDFGECIDDVEARGATLASLNEAAKGAIPTAAEVVE